MLHLPPGLLLSTFPVAFYVLDFFKQSYVPGRRAKCSPKTGPNVPVRLIECPRKTGQLSQEDRSNVPGRQIKCTWKTDQMFYQGKYAKCSRKTGPNAPGRQTKYSTYGNMSNVLGRWGQMYFIDEDQPS